MSALRGEDHDLISGGDIAVDVNVARVFYRIGLSGSTNGDAVRAAARRTYPDPAALDLGACRARRSASEREEAYAVKISRW